jgi:hypothetical protein
MGLTEHCIWLACAVGADLDGDVRHLSAVDFLKGERSDQWLVVSCQCKPPLVLAVCLLSFGELTAVWGRDPTGPSW